MKTLQQNTAHGWHFAKRLLSLGLVLGLLLSLFIPAAAAGESGLASLSVSGVSVIDFDPTQTDYTVYVPQRYADGVAVPPVVPTVSAIPADETATVSVDYPSAVLNGQITVTVTPQSGAPTVYKLALELIGRNLYGDYGFEAGTVGSEAPFETDGQGKMKITDDVALSGTQSIVRPNSSTWVVHSPAVTLEAGKTYLSSYATRTMDGSEYYIYDCVESLTDGQNATVSFYTDGVLLETKQTNNKSDAYKYQPSPLNGQWKVFSAIIAPTTPYDVMHFCVDEMWRNWGSSRLDDMFLSEVVVSEGVITDDSGAELGKLTKPEEGTETFSLAASFKNQLGTTAGLENVTVTRWELAEAYPGVSISDSGVLSYSAEAPNSIKVRAIAANAPNTWQTDGVQCETTIQFIDSSAFAAAELANVTINGFAVPDFRSTRSNYSMYLPYSYQPSQQTVLNNLVVEATPLHEGTSYTVSKPSTLNGGMLTITATAADGTQKVYNIAMHTVGENFYKNSGFEDKDVAYSSSSTSGPAERTTKNPGDGQYCLEIGFKGDFFGFEPRATLSAGKTYLSSKMIRKTDKTVIDDLTVNEDIYWRHDHLNGTSSMMFGNQTLELDGSSYQIKPTDDWKTAYMLMKPAESIQDPQMFHTYTWADWNYLAIDNCFLGELTVADILYQGATEADIPAEGSNRYDLSAKLQNQLGVQYGLENETVLWDLPYAQEGVAVEDGRLVVKETACEGTVWVRATVAPSFGSGYKIAKCFGVTLQTNVANADIPKALNVDVKGVVAEGEVLTADYDYHNTKNIAESGSLYAWYYAATKDEKPQLIQGETSKTFTVTKDYVNGYIFFQVTPVSVEGKAGKPVMSRGMLRPVAPTAQNVTVEGGGYIGAQAVGCYDFYDENGDKEKGSTYRWLRADSVTGPYKPIEGATDATYTVTEEDVEKYICFEVTPRSDVEPFGDSSVQSNGVLLAALPTVEDVTIHKVSDLSYRVSYSYVHPLDVAEGVCSVQWYVDGSAAGTDMSQAVESNVKTISVTVKPIAAEAPVEGKAVTVGLTISQKDSVVGRVPGGGGGGGGGSSIKLVPTPEKTPEPVVEPEPVRHWAADGIDFVLSRGIMQEPQPGDFCNSRLVTRREFIYYVMKTLGYQETAYAHEFNDISGDDYVAGLLQTAVNEGIISRDVSFNPDRNVTRAEMSKILVLASKLEAGSGENLAHFADLENIAEWARGYVGSAVESGLLQGVSETEFNAQGLVTREQTAVLLKRLFDYQNGGAVS